MGCVSSKPLKKSVKRSKVIVCNSSDLGCSHVVSLTSTTYGALKLDRDSTLKPESVGDTCIRQVTQQKEETKKNRQGNEVEVINTWELMSDLEEEVPVLCSSKRFVGKENRGGDINAITTPKDRVLKAWKNSTNSNQKLRSVESPRRSASSKRRILGPQEEQIKKMVSPTKAGCDRDRDPLLDKYEERCPPGGEKCAVMYTTTLRGIRKTFEECNAVRSVMESYHVRVIERDVSMDAGFKEELRKLMGTKEVKVPVVFVKGRFIGGASQVVKLDEEGELQGLLYGIPKIALGCQGCGGIRFVMCANCNGSCKVVDEQRNDIVRCGECNENGIIQCPLCCST
ncbi:hypothetical protein vseg_015148 [Gypsophila vaccaria]